VFNIVIVHVGGMIARRLDEAMAKHKARSQQGVEQNFVKIGRSIAKILMNL